MKVVGCQYDMEIATVYYQRSRCCPEHAAEIDISPQLLPGSTGRCRFCQKCATFHPLSEFNGKTKSCRKKLLEHNARRSKTRQARLGRQRAQHAQQASFETLPLTSSVAVDTTYKNQAALNLPMLPTMTIQQAPSSTRAAGMAPANKPHNGDHQEGIETPIPPPLPTREDSSMLFTFLSVDEPIVTLPDEGNLLSDLDEILEISPPPLPNYLDWSPPKLFRWSQEGVQEEEEDSPANQLNYLTVQHASLSLLAPSLDASLSIPQRQQQQQQQSRAATENFQGHHQPLPLQLSAALAVASFKTFGMHYSKLTPNMYQKLLHEVQERTNL